MMDSMEDSCLSSITSEQLLSAATSSDTVEMEILSVATSEEESVLSVATSSHVQIASKIKRARGSSRSLA